VTMGPFFSWDEPFLSEDWPCSWCCDCHLSRPLVDLSVNEKERRPHPPSTLEDMRTGGMVTYAGLFRVGSGQATTQWPLTPQL